MEKSEYPIDSEGIVLAGVLYRPGGDDEAVHSGPTDGAGPAIVLCHWLPKAKWEEEDEAALDLLAERLASGTGAATLEFNFRGIGESEGDFGINGWCRDLVSAVDLAASDASISQIWVVGVGVGGAVALSVAAGERRIAGAATLGAPAEFASMSLGADAFFVRARATEIIRDPDFPPDPHTWRRELIAFAPVHHVRRIAPNPILIVHGARDEESPPVNAERLAEAAGPTAEKVIVPGDSSIYEDVTTVDLVISWLERQFDAD